MKNLLFLLCVFLVMWACSSNEGESPQEPNIPHMMKYFDISEGDTAGLRIFGYAGCDEDASVVLIGNKNGYLWLHFAKEYLHNNLLSETEFKEVKTIITKSKFNDTRIYDLGYGEVDTVKVSYISFYSNIFTDGKNSRTYRICFHDENNFSISLQFSDYNRSLSWIVYNGEVVDSPHFFENKFLTGYKGWYRESNDHQYLYIFNEKGEILYPYVTYFNYVTFININEYIDVYTSGNHHTIYLSNARKYCNGENFIIWSYSEKLGSIIENHEPQIDYSIEQNNDLIKWVLKATNYDGSKEEKTIKLNVKDGILINE